MTHSFIPDIATIGHFSGHRSIAELAQEVSVYAASPEFVRAHCGPVAIHILEQMPASYYEKADRLGLKPNIDVRVHRLNVGDYPAVPGWHCDGAYRETYFAQPDRERIQIRDTVIATASTDYDGVSTPEFVIEPVKVSVDDPRPDYGFWAQVHNQIPSTVASTKCVDGLLYQFSCETLHRARPARVRGWRLFFRMSMWHNDYLGDEGVVAAQQQVYLVREGAGW